MKIKSLTQADKVLELPGILGRHLHTRNNLEIVHLELAPEKKITEHKLPLHVLFFVMEGQASFTINNINYELEKNQYIEVEPEIERSLRNDSDSTLRLLVIKQNNINN